MRQSENSDNNNSIRGEKMTEKARNDLRSSFEFLGDVKFYLDEAMKHEEEEMERMKIRCIITEVGNLMDRTFELANQKKKKERNISEHCKVCVNSIYCADTAKESGETCMDFKRK